MATTTLRRKLEELGACSDAVQWVGERTLKAAWNECPRGDWLLWLAPRLGVDRRLVVEAACRCAEAVLYLAPEGDDRSLKAIEAARAWIRCEATVKEVRIAANAAFDASRTYACVARASARAAFDAAYTADTAYVYANAAASAARAAAYTASADAYDYALAATADLVRQVITVKELKL